MLIGRRDLTFYQRYKRNKIVKKIYSKSRHPQIGAPTILRQFVDVRMRGKRPKSYRIDMGYDEEKGREVPKQALEEIV